MDHLIESSFDELYKKAVLAFPKTTKRQHAVHPIEVESLRWNPFVGMKTLFIKGQVRNEDRHYDTIVLFKDVDYNKNEVSITSSTGGQYNFAKLSLEGTDISVRCNCNDFKYRFAYYNHLDKSLCGRKPAPYYAKGNGPPANPLQYEGVCKHIMKTVQVLRDSGIFLD